MTTRWLLAVSSLLLLLLQTAEPRKKNDRGMGSSSPLNVTAVQGVSIIELKCRVRVRDCGNFHSIKWYKEPISLDGGRQATVDIMDDVDAIMNMRGTEGPIPAERVYVFYKGQGTAYGSWTGEIYLDTLVTHFKNTVKDDCVIPRGRP